MHPTILHNRLIPLIGALVLLSGVAAYAWTANALFLVAPFAFLFVVLMGLNWKLAWWMLLFCIPASVHLEFLGGTLSTSLPDEPMMWLFLLVFAVLFASRPDILPLWWWRNPLVLVVVLQYIWLIVTVIFSHELLFSVKFLLAKTWFLVSFFVIPVLILREKKDFKKVFWLLLVPMLITMIIIFIRHWMFNFNFRRIEKAIANIYYNHVDYSTVISMFFPVLLVAYPLTKGMRWYWRLSLLLIILFFLPAIYLTYARAAMLAVIFAVVVGIAIRRKLVNWIMPAFYAGMVLLMVYMIRQDKYLDFRPKYEQTYMHFTFTDHVLATFKGRDMSSMERVYRWIAGVRMSKEHPIVGWGPNSFYYYYKPYAVASFRTYVSRNEQQSTTHNYFLYMLTEQGWPAMLLYAILVYVFFAQAQKIFHRTDDRFYRSVTMAAAMMFACCFINNFFSELIETHKVGSLFYLCIAILVIMDYKTRQMRVGQAENA